jgi:hypothetical protein
MTTQANSLTLIDKYYLETASHKFHDNNRDEGFNNFQLVSIPSQHKVYEQIWIDRGTPEGDLQYGEHAFKDCCGQYSSNREKAESIDRYVSKVNQNIESENMRMNANGGYDPSGCIAHRSAPHIYTPEGRFTSQYNDKVQKDIEDFGKNMPPVPPEYENATRVAVIGAMVFSVGIFVADFIRKASGH